MKTLIHAESRESMDTPQVSPYGVAEANFADVASREVVSEDEYTAALIHFLNAYPAHFQQRRTNELCSAGMVIRQDIDAITGVSCPLTVDEVGSIFAHFIQDETGKMLTSIPEASPLGRAAILTMLHCIDQYQRPKVI